MKHPKFSTFTCIYKLQMYARGTKNTNNKHTHTTTVRWKLTMHMHEAEDILYKLKPFSNY